MSTTTNPATGEITLTGDDLTAAREIAALGVLTAAHALVDEASVHMPGDYIGQYVALREAVDVKLLLDSRLNWTLELEHVATLRAMAEEELDRALDEADQDRKYPPPVAGGGQAYVRDRAAAERVLAAVRAEAS